MIDIFLLDIDDTIFDFSKTAYASLKYVCEEMNISFSNEVFECYMRINHSVWSRFERQEIDQQELYELRFKEFFDELKIQKDYIKANDIYFEQLSKYVYYFPQAEEFVKELSKRGKIYLLTNGVGIAQRERIKLSGIDRYISGFFVSDDVGASKPSKEYFYYCYSQIDGFKNDNAIMIGDSLTADIKGANLTGVKSIWFNQKNKEISEAGTPTYIAKTYDEVLKIIDNLNA